jgi:putative ABC transport system permease protein
MAASTNNSPGLLAASVKRKLVLREILALAMESFRADKVRATMTALGMVIGTASLILVVTISLSGKQYVLEQIQNIGSNLIWVEYSGLESSGSTASLRDYLTVDDMTAVQAQLPGVRAASAVLNLHERITVAGGKEKEILILGVNPEYADVRRLRILAGRFFDEQDAQQFNKVAMVTQPFAVRQFGSADLAVGQVIKLNELSFVIAGVFKEGVETFGRSDIQDETILIPYGVARRLAGTNAINLIYFSMYDSDSVPAGTNEVVRIIKARHRPGAVYHADNLSQVLVTAQKTANAFTVVLLLFAAITLIVGGVGIMNIMMATVSSRIREIGIRKAVGATRREIQLQFLVEALLISVIGGTIGTLLGLAVPFSIRFVTGAHLPVPFLSALVAIGVSCSVGIAFGTAPARRAAGLDPVESLRHE